MQRKRKKIERKKLSWYSKKKTKFCSYDKLRTKSDKNVFCRVATIEKMHGAVNTRLLWGETGGCYKGLHNINH